MIILQGMVLTAAGQVSGQKLHREAYTINRNFPHKNTYVIVC